jgi:hypothetical protein
MSGQVTVTIAEDLAAFVEVYQRMKDTDLDLSAFTEVAIREYLAQRGYRMPTAPFWFAPPEQCSGDPSVSIEHDRIFAETHE